MMDKIIILLVVVALAVVGVGALVVSTQPKVPAETIQIPDKIIMEDSADDRPSYRPNIDEPSNYPSRPVVTPTVVTTTKVAAPVVKPAPVKIAPLPIPKPVTIGTPQYITDMQSCRDTGSQVEKVLKNMGEWEAVVTWRCICKSGVTTFGGGIACNQWNDLEPLASPVVPVTTTSTINTSTVTEQSTTITTSVTTTPLVVTTSVVTTPAPTPVVISSIWRPALNSKFQLHFSGTFDPSIDSDVYDIDLFDTPEETIASLHAKGKRVVCYVSAGSWEDWRPDSASFPAAIIGKDYEGWPGENWLDISRIDILGPIMTARLNLAKLKGCDAIDPDNVDVYNVDSGFNLTYAQQITYNKWFATETHKRGMSIGLKNNLDQLPDLLASFDFSILESCHEQGWCNLAEPFVAAGKPVYQIEYTEANASLSEICPAAKQRGFNAFIKHLNLDAFIQRCP